MADPEVFEIPIDWKPRPYQRAAWDAFTGGIKRGAMVWHRRAGKDLFGINFIATQLFQRVGLYWHILPTYAQGMKTVWNGKTKTGRPFLTHLPLRLSTRTREDEMTIWFRNPHDPKLQGSIYQVVGADNADRLVGANPVGCIFSEWALMKPEVWDFIRPILNENDGWAMFLYTPRGKNHGYHLLERARKSNRWFSQVLTVDDTKAVPIELINADRADGMPEEIVQQEYYCSFTAPLLGSYYGESIAWLYGQQPSRIGKVPWEPDLQVNTAWDLGMDDSTSIVFYQQTGKEIRFIDSYSNSGQGLDHYAKVIHEKRYAYKQHFLPWDIRVRELGTGKSRMEVLFKLGINPTVVRKLPVPDGISAVRAMLPRCWFDENQGQNSDLIRALMEYTKEPTGERDQNGRPLFKDTPKHDWTSHFADAMRTAAVGMREVSTYSGPMHPKVAIA